MLYFTDNWPPTAVYTGRFIFVAEAQESEAEGRLRRSKESGFSVRCKVPNSDRVQPAFDEEYRHARLYLRSYTGLLLSGLRYATRVLRMLSKWDRLVNYYYDLRTLFYVTAYLPHELAVASEPSDEALRRKLVKVCDYKALKLWIRAGRRWYVATVILLSPILCLLGFVMGRNPTIIVVELRDNRIIHHNRALEGIVNRAMGHIDSSRMSCLQRALNRLLNSIRIEGWIKEDLDMDWKWLQLKITSERRLWPLFQKEIASVTKLRHVPQDYGTFMRDLSVFVLAWIQGSTVSDFTKILPVLRSIEYSAERKLPEWTYQDPIFRQLVNFFYLHGN